MVSVSVVLTTLLVASGTFRSETAAATDSGTQASVAFHEEQGPKNNRIPKKKLKKLAKKFLRGAVWTHTADEPATGGSAAVSLALCRNGTYLYRKVNSNPSGTSQTLLDGTWRVRNAKQTTAKVGYTVTNFTSTNPDGTPGPDSAPPSSGTFTVLAGTNNAALGLRPWVRRGPGQIAHFFRFPFALTEGVPSSARGSGIC